MSTIAQPSSSSLSIAVSLVPKLTVLTFLYLWLTGTAAVSPGKLGLTLGVLALFDALTVASLRKGSVAAEWRDLPLVLGSLVGPMVLPLYATAAIGVMTFGTQELPEKRQLGGTPVERLANTTPSRFTGPNSSTAPNPSLRPMPPGMQPQLGTPNAPGGSNALASTPSIRNPNRPPFGNLSRPPAPASTQRPAVREVTPSSAAPTPAPGPSTPATPSATPSTSPSSTPAPATSTPAAKP